MTLTESTAEETRWYVIRVISGQEEKIRRAIENALEQERKKNQPAGWTKQIVQVYIPKEKFYQVRAGGKKVLKEKNFIPGYVFLEVRELTEEVIQAIRSITGVIGFLTDSSKNPVPLSREEVQRLMGKVEEVATAPERFHVGERVRIVEGPFQDFVGIIREVQEEKRKLRVEVLIFGRATPVEVFFHQVERAMEEKR